MHQCFIVLRRGFDAMKFAHTHPLRMTDLSRRVSLSPAPGTTSGDPSLPLLSPCLAMSPDVSPPLAVSGARHKVGLPRRRGAEEVGLAPLHCGGSCKDGGARVPPPSLPPPPEVSSLRSSTRTARPATSAASAPSKRQPSRTRAHSPTSAGGLPAAGHVRDTSVTCPRHVHQAGGPAGGGRCRGARADGGGGGGVRRGRGPRALPRFDSDGLQGGVAPEAAREY